jgi:hypothetical protein
MEQFKKQLLQRWSEIRGGASSGYIGAYKKVGLRPNKDWLVVLGFFGVGFICAVGIALYVYGNVLGGAFVSTLPAVTTTSTPMLNQKTLQTVTDYFGQKEQATVSEEQGTTTPTDPS